MFFSHWHENVKMSRSILYRYHFYLDCLFLQYLIIVIKVTNKLESFQPLSVSQVFKNCYKFYKNSELLENLREFYVFPNFSKVSPSFLKLPHVSTVFSTFLKFFHNLPSFHRISQAFLKAYQFSTIFTKFPQG